MSAVRSILLKLEVKPAGRASKCTRNKDHAIPKGQLRFVVTTPGPAQGGQGYCKRCAKAMLKKARADLDGFEAELV